MTQLLHEKKFRTRVGRPEVISVQINSESMGFPGADTILISGAVMGNMQMA